MQVLDSREDSVEVKGKGKGRGRGQIGGGFRAIPATTAASVSKATSTSDSTLASTSTSTSSCCYDMDSASSPATASSSRSGCGSNSDSPAHLPSTYSALLCLGILKADFSRLNIEGLGGFLRGCREGDGSFAPGMKVPSRNMLGRAQRSRLTPTCTESATKENEEDEFARVEKEDKDETRRKQKVEPSNAEETVSVTGPSFESDARMTYIVSAISDMVDDLWIAFRDSNDDDKHRRAKTHTKEKTATATAMKPSTVSSSTRLVAVISDQPTTDPFHRQLTSLAWLASCQSYEGGYSARPGLEAQGGFSYCCLAALEIWKGSSKASLMGSESANEEEIAECQWAKEQEAQGDSEIEQRREDQLEGRRRQKTKDKQDQIRKDRAIRWLIQRQVAPSYTHSSLSASASGSTLASHHETENGHLNVLDASDALHDGGGGFQGRPGKLEDVCYSFWCGASLRLLGGSSGVSSSSSSSCSLNEPSITDSPLFNESANVPSLLLSQSRFGGFGKSPDDDGPDLYHSYLAIAALAMMENPDPDSHSGEASASDGVVGDEQEKEKESGLRSRFGLKKLDPLWNVSVETKAWMREEIRRVKAAKARGEAVADPARA